MPTSYCFVGAGNMGGALLRRGLAAGALAPEHTCIIEKNPNAAQQLGLPSSAQKVPEQVDVLVLAVKPAIFANLAHLPRCRVAASVMAGISCAAIAQKTGTSAVLRTMPNTPALRGQGCIATFAQGVSAADMQELNNFFGSCGQLLPLSKEEDFHAITALSGSGPAYFFALAEAMAKAGEQMGLSAEAAQLAARQTLVGAGSLLSDSKESVAQLRQHVTSPGGTTEAALKSLMPALDSAAKNAMQAAARQSRHLGGEEIAR